ncbi:MAG: hypothetical protein ACXWEY_07295 [Bacteroidia bacterium]
MSTDNYTNNDPIQDEPVRRNRTNVATILLVLLLLASVGFNIFQYYAREKRERVLNESLVDSQSLRDDLQRQRDSLTMQLNDYKGRVGELDTLIAQRERELLEKAEQIDKLLKSNKISYNKYLSVKDDIERYKYYAEKYLKEIDQLSQENKKLASQNETLKTEVKDKSKTIDVLKDQNVSLGNKVSLASRLTAENIIITGVRFKGGSKERETSRASQIEKLKICFDIPENKISYAGNKDVFVQIIDPRGQTVSIDALGSGVTTVDGSETQYTTKEQIAYNNEPINSCVYFGKGTQKFEEGKYNIVIYTEGYKMGEKSFTIK